MMIHSWGRYPICESKILNPDNDISVTDFAQNTTSDWIPRGLGRSYGDSALSGQVLTSKNLDYIIEFDPMTGILTSDAGVTLASLLKVFVPKGWFLPVTPGTQFVSLGGAVASDVHGKNHHGEGSFCDHVLSLKIATPTGMVTCSPTENEPLFRATCGGMGLTGFITQVTLKLNQIKSAYIQEVTHKANNLQEVMSLFEEHKDATYSVAWIDCMATGNELGRSLLMLGEHAQSGGLDAGQPGHLSLPFELPISPLNSFSTRLFNQLYYHRIRSSVQNKTVHYQPFFYPLDGIQNWNRMYGKKGFVQYQCVIPYAAGYQGMKALMDEISASKEASFLAVLKAMGPSNDNYLSFPMEGFTLALDFKYKPNVLALLDRLDDIVLDLGGRLYLTKDARMSEKMFKRGYPKWEEFMEVRESYGANKHIHSLQSKRLGLSS